MKIILDYRMTELNSSLEHHNLGNNESHWLNHTSHMNSSSTTNSTSNYVGNTLQAAGFWTLKDVIFVTTLTFSLFVFSVVFYWTRHLIVKRWPNCSSLKPPDVNRFDTLDEEYPKQTWFGEDQGTTYQ